MISLKKPVFIESQNLYWAHRTALHTVAVFAGVPVRKVYLTLLGAKDRSTTTNQGEAQ